MPKAPKLDSPPAQPITRIPPDQRARAAASNSVAKLAGFLPESGPDISYYSPELIQCTLPHSDPKARDWIRKNGHYSLIVSSGIEDTGDIIGVPYGSFPRLVLAHIITQVIETRERRIELSAHFGGFLRDIGYMGNHKGNGTNGRRIRDQLLRLLNANINFQYKDEMRHSRLNIMIAPKFDLWWNVNQPEEDSLFGSWVELSEDFYQSILLSPVPLRTDILKALKKSPLALDVYMWVSYRLFAMQAAGQHELAVSYGALQEQFGTGIANENYRQFRSAIKSAFRKVAELWQPHTGDTEKLLLNYELNEAGLVLYRSPLLIGRNRPTKQEEARQILSTKTFDAETRKKAKQLAGTWDLDYLTAQYFVWIATKTTPPANPKTSFFGFIRAHCKLNGGGPP